MSRGKARSQKKQRLVISGKGPAPENSYTDGPSRKGIEEKGRTQSHPSRVWPVFLKKSGRENKEKKMNFGGKKETEPEDLWVKGRRERRSSRKKTRWPEKR